MNVPLITWLCIAVAMLLIVIIHVFLSAHERLKEPHKLITQRPVEASHRNKIFSISTEREEFFVPGDRLPHTPDYYGDDDN